MESINVVGDKNILTVEQEYIGSSTRPELHKCYVDRKGQLFFVCRVSSTGLMHIQYIHEDGSLGISQSEYYKSNSQWTSHGRIKGPDRLQCHVCKKMISYKSTIEQKESLRKEIYDNFTLSNN